MLNRTKILQTNGGGMFVEDWNIHSFHCWCLSNKGSV